VLLACLVGGVRLVEFTNRGDFAWQISSQLINELSAENSLLILGAVTIDEVPAMAIPCKNRDQVFFPAGLFFL
jgi:2-dehydro-3-deoxyphosphogluconate aldolase/(4S)-4-hydroxy-2-oxoglutarate aldolase